MGYETRSKSASKSDIPPSTAPEFTRDPSISGREMQEPLPPQRECDSSAPAPGAVAPLAKETQQPPTACGAGTLLATPNAAVSLIESEGRRTSRSSVSHTSTVKARMLAAEAEHARCVAELVKQQNTLELKALLVEQERKTADLELRAKLAEIAADGSVRASSRGSNRSHNLSDSQRRVEKWLPTVQIDEGPHAVKPDEYPGNSATLDTAPRFFEVRDHIPRSTLDKNKNLNKTSNFQIPYTSQPNPIPNDDGRLIRALEAIVNKPRSFNIELPVFDGRSPTDWLAFKRSFLDTQGSYTTIENLARLNASLSGAARDAVFQLLVAANDPMQVVDALELKYGRPELIVLQEINSIRALQRTSAEGKDLANFACKIKNCVAIVRLLDQTDYLRSPELFSAILCKLSPLVRTRWYDYAAERMDGRSRLEVLADFLTREVELQARFGVALDYPSTSSFQATNEKRVRAQCNIVAEKYLQQNINKCVFCNKLHTLIKCDKFLSLSVNDRWQWIKSNKICHRCLENKPHRFNFCKVKSPCGVNGCTYRHHSLLHNDCSEQNIIAHADMDSDSESDSSQVALEKPPEVDVESAAHAATKFFPNFSLIKSRPLLKVVAVTVTGPLCSIQTYALLDDGCTTSFIDSTISKQIGAVGPSKHVRIDCVGGLSRECSVNYVDFEIKGQHCTKSYKLCGVRSIDNLSVSRRSAVTRNDISNLNYLSDLTDVLCYDEAQPMLIIGVDNWELTISTSTRAGKSSQPVAIQTALGWVLYGFVSSKTSQVDIVNHAIFSERDEIDISMDAAVKEYFRLDSIGISIKDYRGASDTHALKTLEKTTRRLSNGQFETGLLWKPDVADVPNNFKLALSRFLSLEKKMKTDKEYANLYKENMHSTFDKGYAEKCNMPPVGITWYLPHFGVTNVNKPGKLRIVHDAAAKFKGVSLNSLLLTGPDLLQPLLGILMRFREDRIALTADIKEMFPQVRIRELDRDSQRFIWRDSPDKPIGIYRMSAMIFGACSSPCSALYVKNLNAKDHEQTFPDAAQATVYDVYMDDYIGSHKDVDKAAKLALDIVILNKKANFEMRDWISNNPRALALLPPEFRSQKLQDVNLGDNTDTTSRVLGLKWKPLCDVISFSFGFKDSTLPIALTKRDALSYLMRIYDPLGILGPIVSRGRVMFQSLWRQGLAWDDELPQAEKQLWEDLFKDFVTSSQLQIPRCYSLSELDIIERELHLFCDASSLAFAAVAYWRILYSDGSVTLALIGSKSRVAPLKPTSIPRLELQGALVAARFASFICSSHKYKPSRRVFWCDSLNVLGWLRSDARSFKPFVAHRIGEILELTEVHEWRWVSTLENAADDATRPKRIVLTQDSRWVVGPKFLHCSVDEWPSLPPVELANKQTLELKSSMSCHLISLESAPISLSVDPNRLSCYLRLIRATARAHKFITLLKDRSGQKDLTADDLRTAEVHIFRQSQLDSFPVEIMSLKNHQPLSRKSRLFNLSPILDNNQLLRLSGRVDRAPDVNEDMKRPIILDPKHQAVRLLILHYHKKAAHGSTEMVVNEIRQRYWVINLRSAVRTVAHHCRLCRLRRAMPWEPPTGDLPTARLTHHQRPFSFVGLDYFGPVFVTIGRRTEKRYVALYTCLVIRAVHLEIVHSLSADAALMSLRRFCARRGTPSEIWSDNGTAFVGVNRLLKGLYGENITTFAANERISWKFIPPSAPFMGGAWERLVRSIKTALKVTLQNRSSSEEVLSTLLVEAEALVNSRPLTHVPADPTSPEALTPFHFILGSSSGQSIPITMTDRDLISRAGWRKSARLLDSFWNRWVREYLPTLIPRRGGGEVPNAKEGDLVLVVDNQLPRGTWPRGRITRIYPGRDGVARIADVATSAGQLKRPMKKLIPLL